MEFLSLSWRDLEENTYLLSQKIKKHKEKPDLIVAVARGGLTIAQLLTDFLKLPITSFTVVSYRDLQQESIPKITFKIGNQLHGQKILLVDDISDTGKTFERGISYLKELGAPKIITASLLIKPWTTFIPDFYVQKTDKWVIFPYEIRETTEALFKKYRSEGKTDEEITAILNKLNIPLWFC